MLIFLPDSTQGMRLSAKLLATLLILFSVWRKHSLNGGESPFFRIRLEFTCNLRISIQETALHKL